MKNKPETGIEEEETKKKKKGEKNRKRQENINEIRHKHTGIRMGSEPNKRQTKIIPKKFQVRANFPFHFLP